MLIDRSILIYFYSFLSSFIEDDLIRVETFVFLFYFLTFKYTLIY